MTYTALTPEQQYLTVQKRLLEFEQQHLLATVNLTAALAADETAQAAIFHSQARKWEASAEAVREMLAELTPPDDGLTPIEDS